MIRDITPVGAIDWETPGRRLYSIPFTSDGSWGRIRIPLAIFCAPRPGATIVAIGGTHGDEYEGPVGLKNLINTLDPGDLAAGRLIVLPALNAPALFADQRQSPLDDGNLNRAFPGDAHGTITRRIARFVTDEVIARADVVIDLHAGGRGFQFAPCVSFHQIDDPATYARYRETALLFGTPFVMIYTSGMGSGLLTEQAEAAGKITIGSELGFGASADLDGIRWAHGGLLNVMRRHGLLTSPIVDLTLPRWERQRVVAQTDIDQYITAPISGVCEPLAEPGAFVRAGTPVVRLHDFERFDEPGIDIPAPIDGFVLCRRFRARTEQGDVVVVIAQEIE